MQICPNKHFFVVFFAGSNVLGDEFVVLCDLLGARRPGWDIYELVRKKN